MMSFIFLHYETDRSPLPFSALVKPPSSSPTLRRMSLGLKAVFTLSDNSRPVCRFKSCINSCCLSLNKQHIKKLFTLRILSIITSRMTLYIWILAPSRVVKMINYFCSTEPKISFLVFVIMTSLKGIGLRPSCSPADTQEEQWLWLTCFESMVQGWNTWGSKHPFCCAVSTGF